MEKRIVVKMGGKREMVFLKDIVYMEKAERKILIHAERGTITFYGRFCNLDGLLDGRFTSPHRSYMFNMDHIAAICGGLVVMDTGQEVSLCRSCMDRLKKTYDLYIMKTIR